MHGYLPPLSIHPYLRFTSATEWVTTCIDFFTGFGFETPSIDRCYDRWCLWFFVRACSHVRDVTVYKTTTVSIQNFSLHVFHPSFHHYSRLFRDSPGLMDFKELCPGDAQNSVRDPCFFPPPQVIKNTTFPILRTFWLSRGVRKQLGPPLTGH